MTDLQDLSPKIRRIFDEDSQKWFFAIVDIIEILTDTTNPSRYWTDLKRKDEELYENIVKFSFRNPKNNRNYQTECADLQGILRIIQSIPSKKAEGIKRWLAEVGQDRIGEYENPQKAIERMKENYRKLGRDENWINARIRNITVRNNLTDEWQDRRIEDGRDIAILTSIIHFGTFDTSINDHKKYKGLYKRENLREHMTTLELILSSLGEEATAEIARHKDAQGMHENKKAAEKGGAIAGDARKKIEVETGKKVVSPSNHLTERQKKRRKLE